MPDMSDPSTRIQVFFLLATCTVRCETTIPYSVLLILNLVDPVPELSSCREVSIHHLWRESDTS